MGHKLELAGCVIFNEEGALLLLHRYGKRNQWELPGGKIDPGEDSAQAAQWELEEETGLQATIVRELGRHDFEEDGWTLGYIWYLAKTDRLAPSIREPNKFDRLKFFSWDELRDHRTELSPNTRNLLAAYQTGTFRL